jgi:hypothetical protein
MDPRFRPTGGAIRLILFIGLIVVFLPAMFGGAALLGVPVDVGWLVGWELNVVFFLGLFFAVVILIINARKVSTAPPHFLSPGPATQASGGIWSVADPGQLIAVPNGSNRIHVTFVPGEDFERARTRAVVKAVEAWEATDTATKANERRSQTLIELPLSLASPHSYRSGQAVDWDLAFDLDGRAPSSCGDPGLLGCQWALDISIDGPGGANARFSQPILVTQPRSRVNSGVLDQPEFSRFEEASASTGPVRVDFRVSPAPLDLAAPAVADLRVFNGGVPRGCQAVRLEIYVRVKVTIEPVLAFDWVIWCEVRPVSTPLPSGETDLHFEIPAINLAWPDVDLPHGWMRGAMRLILDVPSKADVRVGRDLCLCLDKPRQPATATTR